MENDEKKYEDVIKALKGLQNVKAPANFEADLQRRINTEKYSKEEKKNFWQNIFVPSRLVPSLGLAAAAVLVFFIVETSSEEMDNPFLIEPRLREDVITATDMKQLEKKKDEIVRQKSLKQEKPAVDKQMNESGLKSTNEKTIEAEQQPEEMSRLSDEVDYARSQNVAKSFEVRNDSVAPAPASVNLAEGTQQADTIKTGSQIVSGQLMMKEELNFRQVQPSVEEQKVINQLKMQIQSQEKTDKTQK